MNELVVSNNYYKQWTITRTLEPKEYILFNRDTIAIESTAWNLNISVMSFNDKLITEYNRPFLKPLDPRQVKQYQESCIDNIYSEIKKLNFKSIDYVYCRGPGMPLSLNSIKYLYDFLNENLIVTSYATFHGLSHLAEVLFKNEVPSRFLFCYYSGGTTQYIIKEKKEYSILSETLDITIGNLLDRRSKLFPYFCKAYEIEVNFDLVTAELEGTRKNCASFSRYFNLSGIAEQSKNWSYQKLLSFIGNLTIKMICEIGEKTVFFGGGVFNSKSLKRLLMLLKPVEYTFNFEENNSDKSYMHLQNRYINKLQKDLEETVISYCPNLRIVDDYTPYPHNQQFQIPLVKNKFLLFFSEQSSLSKRKIIYSLRKKSFLKEYSKYIEILSYRRHIPKHES